VSDDARPAPAGTGTNARDIRSLVARLGRPHASGGTVVERAALMAEGADLEAAVTWILAHGGEPEISAPPAPQGGLHRPRSNGGGTGAAPRTPRRFILPPGALGP
jgi:hypothetical protein